MSWYNPEAVAELIRRWHHWRPYMQETNIPEEEFKAAAKAWHENGADGEPTQPITTPLEGKLQQQVLDLRNRVRNAETAEAAAENELAELRSDVKRMKSMIQDMSFSRAEHNEKMAAAQAKIDSLHDCVVTLAGLLAETDAELEAATESDDPTYY